MKNGRVVFAVLLLPFIPMHFADDEDEDETEDEDDADEDDDDVVSIIGGCFLMVVVDEDHMLWCRGFVVVSSLRLLPLLECYPNSSP
jgi:hypothetical protein